MSRLTGFDMRLKNLLRNPRILLLLVALYCAALLIFALVLVRLVGLTPCPLCILQRFFYALVGITALVGYLAWWPKLSVRVAGAVVSLWAFLGGLVAFRNVILQRFPAANSLSEGCAVSFGSFVDDVIAALGGTGNCASVEWTLFHLSIADWSLIAFTGLTIVGMWIFSQSKSQDAEVSQGTLVVE